MTERPRSAGDGLPREWPDELRAAVDELASRRRGAAGGEAQVLIARFPEHADALEEWLALAASVDRAAATEREVLGEALGEPVSAADRERARAALRAPGPAPAAALPAAAATAPGGAAAAAAGGAWRGTWWLAAAALVLVLGGALLRERAAEAERGGPLTLGPQAARALAPVGASDDWSIFAWQPAPPAPGASYRLVVEDAAGARLFAADDLSEPSYRPSAAEAERLGAADSIRWRVVYRDASGTETWAQAESSRSGS